MQAELPQELVKPIRGIWLGKPPVYDLQRAGNGELNLYVPYLAGKGDLIAFDYSSKPITAQFEIRYWLGLNHNELVISPMFQSDDDLQSIFPLIAALMFHTNDIDVSDDNFRAWLIANRPKVNKMNMHEDTKNNALFKFLQLREHAGDVKITQEMGQQLFNLLVDRAEAIAHEEMSGDALATDSDKFVLELVNNLINSAKPAPAKPLLTNKLPLDYFIKLNAVYMKRNKLPILSGENCYLAGVYEADALRVLGDPDPVRSMINQKMWHFEIYGIVCRVYSTGHELVLNVERGTLLNMRKKVADDVTKMLKENG